MSGSVKVQFADVVSVLTEKRKCYHRSCFRELQDVNKDLKRQIEELEETLGSWEQGGSIEDHGSMLSQVQATIKLFREELKRQKFRKLYFP